MLEKLADYNKVLCMRFMDKSILNELSSLLDDIEYMVNNDASEDELRAKAVSIREIYTKMQCLITD